MVIGNTTVRQVQRAVAADFFYAFETGRFNKVLIMKEICKLLMNDTRREIDCWFDKNLCFVNNDNSVTFRNPFITMSKIVLSTNAILKVIPALYNGKKL